MYLYLFLFSCSMIPKYLELNLYYINTLLLRHEGPYTCAESPALLVVCALLQLHKQH